MVGPLSFWHRSTWAAARLGAVRPNVSLCDRSSRCLARAMRTRTSSASSRSIRRSLRASVSTAESLLGLERPAEPGAAVALDRRRNSVRMVANAFCRCLCVTPSRRQWMASGPGRVAVGPQQPQGEVPLVVRLSSERARQAVRQDCSFAKKRESLAALLVVVQGGALDGPVRDARKGVETRLSSRSRLPL
jgi:hypothetical protein